MSAFILDDGVVYHTYSVYARGGNVVWGTASGSTARRSGATRATAAEWFRRHDAYEHVVA